MARNTAHKPPVDREFITPLSAGIEIRSDRRAGEKTTLEEKKCDMDVQKPELRRGRDSNYNFNCVRQT